MSLRIAINGYGRIGRCFLRALHESPLGEKLCIVAINEPAPLDSIAYLTRFDSTHGRFPGAVEVANGQLIIDGRRIHVTHATTPDGVDWSGLGIDLLVECSGRYAQRHQLEEFLAAGCPRLLLSHPGQSASDVERTIVFGYNEHTISGNERLLSAASCTTNATIPLLDLLQRHFGLEHVLLTTLHSAMNDQPLIDGYHHADLHRNRSAMQSLIPVTTGLARGVARLLPALSGRIEAKSIRVPVANVSAIDLVATLAQPTRIAEVHECLHRAVRVDFSGRIACSDEPHASIDFNHSPQSAIIDTTQTHLAGDRLLNLLVWFDNEWGFANRMLDVAAHWLARR